jgi:exopolysaccharide production protein ExoY
MDRNRLHLSDRGVRGQGVMDLNGGALPAPTTTAENASVSPKGVAEDPFSSLPAWIPFGKRALDIVCILVALPAGLPLMGLVAIVIKIVSRGPVLFKQERIGYRGKHFRLFKFRTMVVGADTTGHQQHYNQLINSNVPMVKLDQQGDTRLIPLGRLLRASGLDELPQLINVLRGDMSLVGPRPCIPYEYEKYLPWQRERCNALPGLTGLWQVSGKNRTTFAEMIRLDIHYTRNLSMWLDIKIIIKTIPAVVMQIQDLRRRRQHAASSHSSKPPHSNLHNESVAFTK